MCLVIGACLILGLFFPAFWIVIPFLLYLQLTNRAPVLIKPVDPDDYDWDEIFQNLMSVAAGNQITLLDTTGLSGSERRVAIDQLQLLAMTNLPEEIDLSIYIENNIIFIERDT